MKKFLLLLLSIFTFSAAFSAENEIIGSEESILVKIGKKSILLQDIQNKQIHELRKQLYDLLQKELKSKVIQELSKYSKKYSLKTKYKITDEDTRSFYNTNSLSKRGPYKDLKPQIKKYLEVKLLEQRMNSLYEKALKEGMFTSYIDDPGRYLVSVPVETAYLRGNKKAKIMLLEFSDYQCPFCSNIQPVLESLRRKYGNKVAFGYRHLPLAFHAEADESAIAVECARDQNKFEEFHEILFQNRKNQTFEDHKKYAKKVKISDMGIFEKCLKQEKYRSRVNHDMYIAQSLGISGTPGFIIGKYNRKKGILQGEVISGALPEEEFEKTIKKYLF